MEIQNFLSGVGKKILNFRRKSLTLKKRQAFSPFV